jgi:uncharacterized protein (PEP-CTERM system associated)
MRYAAALATLALTRRVALKPIAVAIALVIAAPAAFAATWFVEAGVTGQVTATNNSNFDTSTSRESDVIVALSPTISLRGEGRRLRVSGAAALAAVTYVEGTQGSSFDPVGRFAANLEAIEDWFFIDASLSATRSLANPLAPRLDGASSVNRQTDLTARFSPYIEREFPNDLRLLIRSDNAWTNARRTEGGSAATEYSARHFLRFSRAPRPFGWALEAERRRDDRIDLGVDTSIWYELARLRVAYLLGGQVVLGVRGGYERSELFAEEGSLSFVGADLSWRPSDRTRLDSFWEDRSFGDAWNLLFTHRSPFIAWDLRGSRDLTTFDDAALTLPSTGDLAALLDASLRTRIVDPVERARAVEDFIARRGLPRSLDGPLNVFSEQVVVRTSRTGTLTLIGTRSTVALSGFYQRDQTPVGDAFGLATGQLSDLRQYGATLAYNRQLSSVSSALASLTWSRTRGGVAATAGSSAFGTEANQRTLRIQYDRQLAPRSTGFIGVRLQTYDNDAGIDSRETAVFAGLGHRF